MRGEEVAGAWSRRTALVSVLSVCLVALAAPGRGVAYEAAGHFYTVDVMVVSLLPELPADAAAIVAFCAELPDHTYELDAVQVYKTLASHPLDYAAWLTGSVRRGAAGRMVAVQQLLHGLTGGASEQVTAVANTVVAASVARVKWEEAALGEWDPSILCALGFAFHLYGDSYAHRQLRNAGVMYPTGRGHADDFTMPDHPLYEPDGSRAREAAWERYLTEAALPFTGRALDGGLPRGLFPKVRALEEAVNQERDPFGQYREADFRGLLLGELLARNRVPPYDPPLERWTHESCHEFVAQVLGGPGHDGRRVPECRDAWATFRTDAERAFDAHPLARAPDVSPHAYDDPFEQ